MDKRAASASLGSTAASAHGSSKRKKDDRNTPDGYWENLEPYIKKASREEVESLTKDLFRELWEHSGKDAAVAASAPFWKKIKENGNNNQKLQGTWILDNKGTLTIHDKLESGIYRSSSVDVEELHLESSKSVDLLVYVGDADRWEHCRDDFVVKLKIGFNPDDDTIKGDIEVSSFRPYNPDDHTINGIDVSSYYPPPGAFGFTGTREGADESGDEDE